MHLKRTIDDINHYFSNPDPDLPITISPIIDEVGLLFNSFRIIFDPNSPQFKIDTKNFIFTLTKGLIDLMNGGDFDLADYKDLVAYSKFLHRIKRTGADTNRSKKVKVYIKAIEHPEYEVDEVGDYAENYTPIIQEIDEFEDMVSGQGITFLSDNNEELLNRLRVILAAMKEGHRSKRQYNEVNCILKRLLEKDYEYELDRNQEYELGLKYFSVYNSIRNINEKNNQIKISTDNGVTFKTIRLLPGSYEYIAIYEHLSEYAGKNNIEFEGNLNLNKIKLILRNNSQVDFNVENSLNTLLGFDKRVYTQSTLAPHKANIENDIDVINIQCNLINGGFFNKYKRQIIYSLPTFTVPIGYRIIEKPFQTTYLPLNSFMIKDINLEIKDGKNRFIDFGNEEIVIQLHLKQKN
ncbi:hypothetical protein LOTGIDRAFT_158543 [Lottia gigantea]|uniref:Uncharacterized protein n=1 Tax=Lottia gigantea TaxID=225164 RepID=V4A6C9_LOTGI|nr:hypothetical protein LOTGIDRAFT_158543 [Lottia gigantea]ESO99458.1 hypothetical protein LOTGIDRAFT_158543 [Lottia gigantea]